MISKNLLKRLDWTIDKPTRLTFIAADGKVNRPLGRVEDIPVTFGPAIIPINAVVTSADTYDLILGNDWISKAKAVMDFRKHKLQITWKGRTYAIPLDIHKGIRPERQVKKVESEEEIDEEPDAEIYVANTIADDYRNLTEEERNWCYTKMLQQTRCAFCETRVYCAEHACQCLWTTKIPTNTTLEQQWDSFQKNWHEKQQKKVRTLVQQAMEYFNYDTRAWQYQEKNQEHPFCNHDDHDLWEDYWTEN